jgi:hypothetical protein
VPADDALLGQLRLAQTLHEQTVDRQLVDVSLDGRVSTDEAHREPVARAQLVRVDELVEIRALDDERAVRGAFRPTAGRVERMDDREAQPPTGGENPCCLPHRSCQVVDVLERHERHDERERCIREWEVGRVRQVQLNLGRHLASRGDHRR